MQRSFILVAAVALMLATGCKSTMAEFIESEDFVVSSAKLKGAKIDEKASTLDWRTETWMDFPKPVAELIAEMRGDMAAGFNHVLLSGDGKPARFRVTVLEAERETWLLVAPCLVLLTLVGCPAGLTSAKVEVELEVDGKVYKETGESSGVIFLYSDELEPFPAQEVAYAVVDALRKIDSSGAR